MRDDVTICVPTFNGREKFAYRAVASVKGQARVLVQHGLDTPRDHAFATWWEAIYRAQTRYVGLLFDDDWYEPTFVDRCMALMDDDTAYVFSEAMIRYPDGTARVNIGIERGGKCTSASVEATLLATPLTISPACAIFRRADALNCLLPGGVPLMAAGGSYQNAGSDLLLMLLPLLAYPFVGCVTDPLVNFDAGEQSTTAVAMKDPAQARQLYDRYSTARGFYQTLKAGLK